MKIKEKLLQLWVNQFWPVTLMKDCSIGKPLERFMAYQYNQEKVCLLQIPILNWLIICIFSACGINICEWLQKNFFPTAIYFAAFFGVALVVCVVAVIVLGISYIFLKNVDIKLEAI